MSKKEPEHSHHEAPPQAETGKPIDVEFTPLEESGHAEADAAQAAAAGLRRVQCDLTITKHVSLAVGAGFVPLPVFDVMAVSGVQLDMLYRLCRIYNVPFSREAARSMISALVGASIPAGPAGMLASGVKMIPGIGTALGLFTSPSLYAATTYAVGRVFVEHLESGGTLLTFDASKMKAHFERALKRAPHMAAETQP
jgi:uncharacterized protein (DUF697 family)